MIITVDHILLNGAQGAPDTLADAELYLDDDAGLLYVTTEEGLFAVPIAALVPPALSDDTGQALIKTPEGATYATLVPGAGGRPFGTEDWRIPGAAPTGVGSADFEADTYYALFEMSLPGMLSHVRVVLESDADVTYGVCEWRAGAPADVLTTSTASGAGRHDDDVSVSLAPGVYATYFTPTSPVAAKVIHCSFDLSRFTPNFVGHPVGLGF